MPNIKFVIVGGGPLEQLLREESASLGLQGRVVFTGWRNDALELIPSMDVFVMSSLWEAMSIVLLEAMAASRPIVVTDVGDNSRVIEHGVSGLVVAPKDAEGIASAVLQIYKDSGLAGHLARQANARFVRNYTVRQMVEEHERLYRHLAATRRLSVPLR